MSQIVETPTRTFVAGAAITKNIRVKLTSEKLAAAAIGEKEIGTIRAETFADLDEVAVRLVTAQGTVKMVANGAVTLGADVFSAASGKVSATQGATSFRIGVALEAATADGDFIEVLRDSRGEETVGVSGAQEALTTAAPAASVEGTSTIDSTANAVAATLASGTVIGQQKLFVMTNATNSSTVTIALHETSDPEVATFNAVDEYGLFMWTGTEWVTVSATCTFV